MMENKCLVIEVWKTLYLEAEYTVQNKEKDAIATIVEERPLK